MPKIHTLALSPDGQYAAFVLFPNSAQQQNGSLYITRLDWPQATNSDGYVFSLRSSTISADHIP
jgi:hypothetical protein